MITVVPDSSFYICFIDDISKPEYLIKLLNHPSFRFVTGQKIKEEITRSPNYHAVEKYIDDYVDYFEYYNYSEILRPFFSLEEIRKGEHEVIAISYILYILEATFIAILDEDSAREFIKRNLPQLWKMGRVMGTVGFIKLCCCIYHIFLKEEAVSVLELIKRSKFRVKRADVDRIIEEVKRC